MTKYTFSEHDIDNAKTVFATDWASPSEAEIAAFNVLLKETLAPEYLTRISAPQRKHPDF